MRIAFVGLIALMGAAAAPATGPATATTSPTSRPVRDISATVGDVLGKNPQLPGLIGAVVELDGCTAIGVAGVRKTGGNLKIKPNDFFHLGSDTKSMTAFLIGQLIDEKKLRMDSTLAELFPKVTPQINEKAGKITVAQLLSHRAGLTANLKWTTYMAVGGAMNKKRQAVVAQVISSEPEIEPGAKYSYSNTGYVVLGAIVESIEGKIWEEVMREKLLRPLGIKTMNFGPVPASGQPWGHIRRGADLVAVQGDNPAVMGPAGAAYSTIEDWGKYIALCLRASKGDTPLISAATYKLLVNPAKGDEYAGGWIVTERPWAGGRALTHAGSNTMWYCVAWLAPEKDVAFLAATNDGEAAASKACDDLVGALIEYRAKGKP